MEINLDTLLADVREALANWRGLEYNAAQALDGRSFGRCLREIERLERTEDDLLRRIRAAHGPVKIDTSQMQRDAEAGHELRARTA